MKRFWSKVKRTRSCWLWTGKLSEKGYGCFRTGGKGSKTMRAHRAAWELSGNYIPPGLCVLHRCDNRQCVNPKHLFLGTLADNVADCVSKGRQARGEKNRHAKLSEQDVLKIRKALARGEQGKLIAARYKVTPTAISYIRNRKVWVHI